MPPDTHTVVLGLPPCSMGQFVLAGASPHAETVSALGTPPAPSYLSPVRDAQPARRGKFRDVRQRRPVSSFRRSFFCVPPLLPVLFFPSAATPVFHARNTALPAPCPAGVCTDPLHHGRGRICRRHAVGPGGAACGRKRWRDPQRGRHAAGPATAHAPQHALTQHRQTDRGQGEGVWGVLSGAASLLLALSPPHSIVCVRRRRRAIQAQARPKPPRIALRVRVPRPRAE